MKTKKIQVKTKKKKSGLLQNVDGASLPSYNTKKRKSKNQVETKALQESANVTDTEKSQQQAHLEASGVPTLSNQHKVNLQPPVLKTEPDCVPFLIPRGLNIYQMVERESPLIVKEEHQANYLDVKTEPPEEASLGESSLEDDTAFPSSVFPCPHCSVSFTDFSYLDKHFKWCHQSDYLVWVKKHKVYSCSNIASTMLSCSSCHYRFFSEKELNAHERKVHLPSPKPVAKRFTCPHCDRSFDYIGNLQNHCRRCHGLVTLCKDGHISCAKCGKSFSGVWGLGPHRCSHQESGSHMDGPICTDRGYLCRYCGKNCTTLQCLTIHTRTHTGERPYACTDCDHRFTDMGSLRKHRVVHTGIKPHKCPECGKDFSRMGHLISHLRTHTGERPYPCLECGMRFSHRSTLRLHQGVHSKVKQYACPDCGKSFSSPRYVKAHQRTHDTEKTFECKICGKLFTREDVMKKHLRLHTGERPYQCNVCAKRFNRIEHLKNHTRTHTGEKPYTCEQCGSSYAQSGDLTKHMRRHNGEKPFACPVCDRRFNNSGDLGKHRRIHTEHRPYECLECGKCFLTPRYLTLHVRTHTGERPHSCPQCPRSFTRSQHLARHMKKHL